jgi:hypothetical protein
MAVPVRREGDFRGDIEPFAEWPVVLALEHSAP